jgi:hypothetical protein
MMPGSPVTYSGLPLPDGVPFGPGSESRLSRSRDRQGAVGRCNERCT